MSEMGIYHKGVEGSTFHAALGDFATPEGLVSTYPELFTLSQLRWALRFRKHNGLGAHVTQMGRRLYIHVPGFTEWFWNQGNQSGR